MKRWREWADHKGNGRRHKGSADGPPAFPNQPHGMALGVAASSMPSDAGRSHRGLLPAGGGGRSRRLPKHHQQRGHSSEMKIRFSILLSAAVLATAILVVFRGNVHARGPHHLTTECGFWGPMEAGMSCR